MNHYAKREIELPLWRRVASWLGLLFLLALMVCFFWIPMHAQERSNTYYAAQFAGADVGAKITAAQAQCSPNTAIPCTIVIDAILAGWPQGTPPARCAQCYWIDYTSASGWKVTPLVFTPTNLTIAEAAAPAGMAASDILYADSTAHRWKMLNNNGVAAQVVGSGVDVNTSDQVTQLHFGATATPLSGTAPTTGQVLQWNGTNIVGASVPQILQLTSDQTVTGTTMTNVTGMSFSAAANTNYRLTCSFWGLVVTGGAGQIQWTGPAAPTAVIYGSAVVATGFGTALSTNFSTGLGYYSAPFALINGANAGTVQLQMNNNTVGDGVILKAGSYCIVQ